MKTIADGMNIGEAAEKAGVTPKMVRHYEALGLLPKVHRTESGYRVYGEPEVHTLRFIRRSRDLGFSIAEIGELVKLWQDRRRPSSSVKKVAAAHLAELDRKIEQMLLAESRHQMSGAQTCRRSGVSLRRCWPCTMLSRPGV